MRSRHRKHGYRVGRKEKREGSLGEVRVKAALTLTLPPLSPLFSPAT